MADETNDIEETEGAAAAKPPEPSPPAEVLAPKERRVRARAAKSAKIGVKPASSPEERQAEREATRAQKAAARKLERAHAREKAKAQAHQAAVTPAREHVEGRQKTRQGVVVSDKAAKTITVRIDLARRHRRYAKIVRTSQTLHAHDEQGEAHIGDTVVVRECRPMSRTKRWRLVEVVERAR